VGAQYLKRLGLELGGKTPHLVFDDSNIDAALPVLEKSLTVFAGQFCMTGSRLLVQRAVANQVREKLANRLLDLKVGRASDPRSDMGPLIDKPNVARVDHAVEEAIAQGARIVVRGGPIVEGELARGGILSTNSAGGRRSTSGYRAERNVRTSAYHAAVRYRGRGNLLGQR
jgi:betaine-aldehyde dehydrogenase